MIKSVLLAVCLSGFLTLTQAATKKDDIKKMLDMTESYKVAAIVMDQVLITLKPMAPDVPEKVWKEFSGKISKEVLYDLVTPIYDKHLSHDDIKALIKFYQTPTGQKFIKVTPQITQESMAAGQQLGQKLMQDIISDLKAKGYKVQEI